MDDNFSSRVKDVISYSKEEALRLGHNQIGTEHLLLGKLRDGGGKAISILNSIDINLEELRKKVLCVSFTLLSNRLVFLNSKANKINWDLILSCETLEVYKPNINAYLKTAKMLQLKPEECVMIACHSFDLNAAKKAGFNTVFVKRAQEWGPDTKISIDGDYDMVIEDFNELMHIIG